MDEFENEDEEEEIKESKQKGIGWLKIILFIFICILGVTMGLAFGFYLGIVSLVNVIGDLSEEINATIIIDFDEEVAMDYMVKFMQEEYGDLIAAAALGKDLEVNMTDNEKIYAIIDGLNIDQLGQVIEIDNKTIRLLEEAKNYPEQRDISQTMQNFVPEGLE